MKKSSPAFPNRTFGQKLLKAATRGRLAAFFILAIVSAAVAVTTISLAQSKKSARLAQNSLAQNSKAPQLVSKDSGSGAARSPFFLQEPSQSAQEQRQVPVLTLQNA